jgi:hypothetical protein
MDEKVYIEVEVDTGLEATSRDFEVALQFHRFSVRHRTQCHHSRSDANFILYFQRARDSLWSRYEVCSGCAVAIINVIAGNNLYMNFRGYVVRENREFLHGGGLTQLPLVPP